ncbi:MAG: FAD-binding protein [Candidatus Hatepunaea meridiana]|nr:FAD-binding protein [Candidatus Hatepunaea meridiana]
MLKHSIQINNIPIPVYSLNTLIIGSGAAALNAAVNLVEFGQENIAIVTDNWGGGTSNNAGSDKQTYYKLSLSGKIPDSPFEMAQDLFNGGCMHGDIALCEAQHSAQAFYHLVQLGVPFPHDKYGGYIGYKTDHDPRGRGTSAGPLTSHLMFEALARDVKRKNIPVLDKYEIIALLTDIKGDEKHVVGAIALNKKELDNENMGFTVFNAVNVILGTGGPAGMYKTSVYPESQTGSSGLAFQIGAIGHNLTESQFGLASINFRWNLSGSYQQVIPRYISTDQNGNDEREFLDDYFSDMSTLSTAIFLKGYEWPFDPRKVKDYGSSLIDILVYQETVRKGRRVFLDFTKNPSGNGKMQDFTPEVLNKEAYDYLKNSDALRETPIERLQKLNQPAIDLYKDHNIDITVEYLEIAVCAQHNNGGLKGNIWWESNIKHLFPIGEVNGTHGVYRPGGSALNAGQVGSLRAAMFISKRYNTDYLKSDDFINSTELQIKDTFEFAMKIINPDKTKRAPLSSTLYEIQERMTGYGAHIRNPAEIKQAVSEAWELYLNLKSGVSVHSAKELPQVFKVLDLCLTHAIYLEAISEYLEKNGKSRGSYLVLNPKGSKPCDELGYEWRFGLNEDDAFVNQKILEIHFDEYMKVQKNWVDVRSVPDDELWFEKVWKEYRDGEVIK